MVHLGNNIARLRGLRRIPQKEMACKLKMSQQDYSKLEARGEIDDDLLALIAAALDVVPDAIKHFNEDAVIFNIENMNDNAANYQYHFNPIDKVESLYERLLSEKEELLKRKDEIIKQKDEIIEIYKQQQQKAS